MAKLPDLPDYTERRLRGEVVHDGGFVRLERDEVRTPAGKTAERHVVRHCGAVGVVPLFAGGDVLLVHQYRYAVGEHCLEIPAGKLDVDGEDELACAQRELLEETGHTAARWSKLFTTYSSVGFTDEVLHIFLAEDLTAHGASHAGEDEFTLPVRVDLAEMERRFAAGQLPEARTQMALMWLLLRNNSLLANMVAPV